MVYKKSKETKQKLIETAKQLFSEKGFNKTTMRDIAKNVGITHPLAYYYFNCKHAIANELLDDYFYRLSKQLTQYMKPNDDIFLFLLVLIKFVFREVSQNKKDLDFYIEAYINNYSSTHETDNTLIEYSLLIAKDLGINVDYEHARLSIVISGAVWSRLYVEKIEKKSSITAREIRDTTDFVRWSYIGLDRTLIFNKIEESYAALEHIPILGVRLLNA